MNVQGNADRFSRTRVVVVSGLLWLGLGCGSDGGSTPDTADAGGGGVGGGQSGTGPAQGGRQSGVETAQGGLEDSRAESAGGDAGTLALGGGRGGSGPSSGNGVSGHEQIGGAQAGAPEPSAGAGGAKPATGWELHGQWPTYGHALDQSRNKRNVDASLASEPALSWAVSLPPVRHTMFYSSAAVGDAGTLYIPFFGEWDYYPSGGIQAVSAEGDPLWYFASRETEAQSPVVVRDRATGDTVVLFGSAGRPYGDPIAPDAAHHFPSMMAIYDKPECRCCVSRDEAANFCEFSCVEDSLCEPYDPESPYEWRHMGHVDAQSGEATCDTINPDCAAWLVSSDELDSERVPASAAVGYYEVSSTPLLSQDGRTVYYTLCGVDLLVNLTNLVVAMDVESKAVKWFLTEDEPDGWDQGECSSGHNQLGWIMSNALLSDGSILIGTRAGCLVRIVDLGDRGQTNGIYKGIHPSAVGLTVERSETEGDFIYVATHGQVRQQPGDLYKTSRSRLTASGTDHEPLWTHSVGKAIAPDDWANDGPGLFGSPLVVHAGGSVSVYVTAGDWPDEGDSTWLNPDRGWLVRVPGDGPDGSEQTLPLELDGQWYPAFNVTMDANGTLWLHGGQNHAVENSGRILRTGVDLSGLVSLGTTSRFGFSEITLGDSYLYAVSAPTWDEEDIVSPVVYRFE
jgi:hypothetical protein